MEGRTVSKAYAYKAADLKLPAGYTARDINDELARIVVMKSVIGKTVDNQPIIETVEYRIDNPVVQVIRNGGVTMRIIDAKGEVHLVPGPGYRGATHKWIPRDPANPIQF